MREVKPNIFIEPENGLDEKTVKESLKDGEKILCLLNESGQGLDSYEDDPKILKEILAEKEVVIEEVD